MKELPKRYTVEEDKRIWEVVEQGQREGKSANSLFDNLASELERSAIAINYRYYNVLRKRMADGEQQDLFGDRFIPYSPDDGQRDRRMGNPNYRNYTEEEDERIWEALQLAEQEGIPISAVNTKLAEELNRTPTAVDARGHILKRRHKEATQSEEDDGDDDGSVLNRLKTLVKERDMYKKMCESSEDKIKDYDRMAKELRQIRRLLAD